MTMHSDSYFCVGASHNVCQDYALAGRTANGKAYAIVSDGCSGSPNTDFGSRFMVKSMQAALEKGEVGMGAFLYASAMAQQMASSCNLEGECLDATVLVAIEHEKEGRPGVWVGAAGDGVVLARHRGRSYYDSYLIDFYSGYPAYSSYMLDIIRMHEFIKQTDGGLASIRFSNGEQDTIDTTQYRFYSTQTIDWFHPYEMFFDAEKYDVVMLFSDGVGSFQAPETSATVKRRVPVSFEKVLDQMVDFKSLNGEFVVRRAKRFLSSNDWVHYDDFGVAAVSMSKEK